MFVVFLLLEGAWSDTLDFCFFCLLSRCTLCNTWGSGASVAPLIPWGPQTRALDQSSLGVPWIPFCQLHRIFFFLGGSALSYLVVLGHTSLECPCSSLARFISVLWALPGVIARISSSWGDLLRQDISMALLTDWSWPPSLDRMCLLKLLIDLSCRTAWPDQGACRTPQDWLYHHMELLWSPDQMRR